LPTASRTARGRRRQCLYKGQLGGMKRGGRGGQAGRGDGGGQGGRGGQAGRGGQGAEATVAAKAEGAPDGAGSSAARAAGRRPEVKVRYEKVQKVVFLESTNRNFILKNAKEKLSIIATSSDTVNNFFYRL
jgi:hypothetical protein